MSLKRLLFKNDYKTSSRFRAKLNFCTTKTTIDYRL
nr:MAG TPA: hypothetical protein [Caudoviricetes sp.]DAX85216.1 MAG TPA: hypothetical protein [Caudoviricetes sp.]